MAWFFQFQVAHVVVHITSPLPRFKQEVQQLTQLYRSVEQPTSHLNFSITQQADDYILKLGQDTVWQSSDARDISPALELALYQNILIQLDGQLISLHASTIAWKNQAITFAGISGAGKSSLCTAALLGGAAYVTDEFSLLAQNGQIHPFPRPLQWDSIEHPAFDVQAMLDSNLFDKGEFSFPSPEGKVLTSHLWLPKNIQHQALPLGRLILPQYHVQSPSALLTPMRRSEALMHLPEHLHTRLTYPEMLKELNQRLPMNIQFYRLDFSDVFAAWEKVKQLF